MSPEPKSLFTVCRYDKPEQIERKIGVLIRIYLDNHSPVIAQVVVEHINAILAHPGFIVDVEQRCRFRQLAAHWRCLAWIYNDATDTSQRTGLHQIADKTGANGHDGYELLEYNPGYGDPGLQ